MSQESVFFVGDIQGCLGPLEALLRTAGYHPDRHRLVPLGDTINRGPDNLGVLTLLRTLGADPILGNHEVRILSAAKSPDRDPWLLRQTVMADLLRSPQGDALLDWVGTWPAWRQEEGWTAVHAGLHPRLAIAETSQRFLVSVRVCDPDGNLPVHWDGMPATVPKGFHPWHHYYRGSREVYYGHYARQGLHIAGNTRGLDSGCVYGGSLTGCWYPENRVVQVPCG